MNNLYLFTEATVFFSFSVWWESKSWGKGNCNVPHGVSVAKNHFSLLSDIKLWLLICWDHKTYVWNSFVLVHNRAFYARIVLQFHFQKHFGQLLDILDVLLVWIQILQTEWSQYQPQNDLSQLMRMCYCGGTEIDQFCSFLTSHFWLLQIDFVVKISVVTTSKPPKKQFITSYENALFIAF